jgi:hypothetical protein
MKSHPLHQKTGRPGGGVLLCSAGLNLLLLSMVLGFAKSHLAKPPPSPARTVVGSQVSQIPEAAPNELDAVVTNQLPFRWAQLESEDFRIYIANLRAARCPERIIYDLIFHDLERLYETKKAALPCPDVF